MDFSAIGYEGAAGNGLAFSPFSSSNDVVETNKHKWYGSNNVKHEERMEKCEDDWKDLKVAKTSECFFKEMRCNNGENVLSKDHHQQQQMISFSDCNSQMLSFAQHTSNVNSRIPGTFLFGKYINMIQCLLKNLLSI
ncbi:hypothetical protein LIER_44029 [Lithospermum erythrorhizon]|uniref:Uncharacterized protein n=1 Tax=Lithospermum erythrorhizon TaxID=34254 RepID=A0AAV3RPN1_LITER